MLITLPPEMTMICEVIPGLNPLLPAGSVIFPVWTL